MNYPIYLDYNATTPVDPRVLEAMKPFFTHDFGNPSSNHPYGWEALQGVRNAREEVASLLECDPDEIVFTSGGTEANNLAILGAIGSCTQPGSIVTSTVEHPATEAPCRHLELKEWKVLRLPVDGTGVVDLKAVETGIGDSTRLVTIMHANNETGSIQPIRAIADIANRYGAVVHTDAAQSTGKVSTRVDDLGVDLLSIAGHKLYAPKGVGALYVRRNTSLDPVLLGAGHEKGLRPGTENVASIVGLGAACRIARDDMDEKAPKIQALRDELWRKLSDAIPTIRLNGHSTERLPNTLNVSFPHIRSNLLLAKADRIAASTGSACHEGGDEVPSAVLTAMGLSNDLALGAVRLTLGRNTTQMDINSAAESLIQAYRDCRQV